jgi:hypothetical protein
LKGENNVFDAPIEIGDFAITIWREAGYDDRWHVKVWPRFADSREQAYIVEYSQFDPPPRTNAEAEAVLEAIRGKRTGRNVIS